MSKERPMIRAALFDMDGLLINTEDMYTIASNRVLAEFGKPSLPWEVKLDLQGRPGAAAAQRLIDWAQLPLTPEQLYERTSKVQTELWPTTKFLPGALELLQHLKASDVPIALATSSMRDKYEMKTAHLRHGFDLFGELTVTGDDPRIAPGRGKPMPDIWLLALRDLNDKRRSAGLDEILPEETLVFEDGIPGVEGGRAANMNVVWVPHPEARKILSSERMSSVIGSGEILTSLEHFQPEKYGLPACRSKI